MSAGSDPVMTGRSDRACGMTGDNAGCGKTSHFAAGHTPRSFPGGHSRSLPVGETGGYDRALRPGHGEGSKLPHATTSSLTIGRIGRTRSTPFPGPTSPALKAERRATGSLLACDSGTRMRGSLPAMLRNTGDEHVAARVARDKHRSIPRVSKPATKGANER
jgi:hypothetical protein